MCLPVNTKPTNPFAALPSQVHVATGHDGRRLAVKVQHAGLRETAVADIATINFIVKMVRYIFPVRRRLVGGGIIGLEMKGR